MNNSYETPEVVELGRTDQLILGNPKYPVGMWDSVVDPLAYWGSNDEDEG